MLRSRAPNLAQYLTECSSGSWSKGFGDCLRWNAQNMLIGATRSGAATVAYWNVAPDETGGPKLGGCPSCRGLVTIDRRTGNVKYSPEHHTLGQLAMITDPGAVRVDTPWSGPGGLAPRVSLGEGTLLLICGRGPRHPAMSGPCPMVPW
ncbi:hypothetical protein [Frankia sp. QA3]|uniref:hypothetical protein n=1 Tax=Frankia sp. QA3 TaxID=710111 RepID=UPI0002FF5777|nr:hypothetical protein [Frankia sp. QA3]